MHSQRFRVVGTRESERASVTLRTITVVPQATSKKSPMYGARDDFDPSKDLIDLRGKVVIVTGGK